MYALLIFDKVFIFDLTAYYGLFSLSEVNLKGYYVIRNYKDVLLHYRDNYFENEIGDMEQLYNFLLRVCVNYLKDLVLF